MKNWISILIQAFTFLSACSVFGANQLQDSESSNQALNQALKHYSKAKTLEIKVNKKTKNEILAKETSESGTLFVGQKMFRFEVEHPIKTKSFFDGVVLWNIQYPDKGTKAKIQAGRVLLSKKNRDQLVFLDLLSGLDVGRAFKVSKSSGKDRGPLYLAKAKDVQSPVQKLEILLDSSETKILEISYSDDLENRISYFLSDEKSLKNKKPKSFFQFSPGKDVEVTDL
jgi:hypothetical protein